MPSGTLNVVATLPGSELAGLRYAPLWDFFADAEK